MKICVIGAGYVGLATGACFAETGNDVICTDKDTTKLDKLKLGIIPIFEPGLEALIQSNVKERRLKFSGNSDTAVQQSQVCIIAVGTPRTEDGSANLQYVYEVAQSIGKAINGYKVIAIKSTVPVGTAEKVNNIIKSYTNYDFDVVSNPEFLKQGAAVDDFLRPDRVVIGAESDKALEIMRNLYASFAKNQNSIITMDTKSAEMVKYASNSFLAVKISYINEIANICEKVGADINKVRIGMCTDTRIGTKFLSPGLGYGGSCLPKDVKALIKTAKDNDYECQLIKSADTINRNQRLLFIDKILKYFGKDLSGKTFAVWGLAFKPKTNDMRGAPAVTIINALLEKGAKVKTYDPIAYECALQIFGNRIEYGKSAYKVLKGADCLLIITEWDEFKKPDFYGIKSLMRTPIIFDGRNQYNPAEMAEKGFEYYCIGKPVTAAGQQSRIN